MELPTLGHFSNQELLSSLVSLRQKENESLSDIVLHLKELDTRGLYREAGYSSLFSYCTKKLGYSEGAAQRRITAARLLTANPEIYEKLRSGSLSLCQVAEISRVLDGKNKETLLSAAEGKTKLEVQSLVAQYVKPESPKKETIRVKKVEVPKVADLFSTVEEKQVEQRFSLSLEADASFMKLYEEARSLIGPCRMTEVFSRAMKEFIQKRRPRVRRLKKRSITRSRHIPLAVRDEVVLRDKGMCTFIGLEGQRCGETHALQMDHIKPYALGGTNEAENLRLLCPSHNKLLAEQVFGKAFVQSCVRRHRGGDL